MLISEFDYELPATLIAQEPLARREASRMLVVNRGTNDFTDADFVNFPEFVGAGDCVVLNNTRVFPARLVGRRENHTGKIELFLVRQNENQIWETLARPARRLQTGTRIIFDGDLSAIVVDKNADGRVFVRFDAGEDFFDRLERIGQTPLPPYIRRDEKPDDRDRERYQTVFARTRGAIAAPTAGLHFTPEILEKVRARGANVAEITLHVGYGTFEPVRETDLTNHRVAPEFVHISADAAQIINETKRAGKRIFAVGTTTTRALEAATNADGELEEKSGFADLTVTPEFKFKTVDALLTNFHLPQSSLLVLVSTFAGHDLVMRAYHHAVRAEYRFYSYGDCMLII